MRLVALATALFLPAASLAGVATVTDDHIAPGYARFAEATAALDAAATADCRAEAVRAAYHTAFDAWLGVSHIRFGPIEEKGLALTIAFWPDPKNSTGKALGRLTGSADPVVDDARAFRDVSAAARGFFALERLITGDAAAYAPESYECRLVTAIAGDLALTGATLAEAWPAHAALLKAAGEAGNAIYLSAGEAQSTLYTSISTGLEFLHDQRLGRPLGSFERPKPRQAEARRSGRSLRNITLALTSLREMTEALAGENAPGTLAAFDKAIAHAEALDDPALQGVADPAKRLKVEVLQRMVRDIQVEVIEEIGRGLGVTAGFNALDGD